MATKKTTRLKTAAAQAPQSKEAVVADIKAIGDAHREVMRLTADMNDKVAALQQQYAADAAPFNERIETLQIGVQAWCEANRDDLTNGDKTKTVDFVTGLVKWRIKPPSVAVRGAEAVIALLKSSGLGRFVRTKEEVNKEAILNEADAVRGVAGLAINSGVEEFVIEPHDQQLDAA